MFLYFFLPNNSTMVIRVHTNIITYNDISKISLLLLEVTFYKHLAFNQIVIKICHDPIKSQQKFKNIMLYKIIP
jgi:hypothetical protein